MGRGKPWGGGRDTGRGGGGWAAPCPEANGGGGKGGGAPMAPPAPAPGTGPGPGHGPGPSPPAAPEPSSSKGKPRRSSSAAVWGLRSTRLGILPPLGGLPSWEGAVGAKPTPGHPLSRDNVFAFLWVPGDSHRTAGEKTKGQKDRKGCLQRGHHGDSRGPSGEQPHIPRERKTRACRRPGRASLSRRRRPMPGLPGGSPPAGGGGRHALWRSKAAGAFSKGGGWLGHQAGQSNK